LKENSERIKIRLGTKGIEEAARSDGLIIVVDVLRASSTIITAMANGASSVLPVMGIGDARLIAKSTPHSILGGERKGLRIAGFHLGNSPLEYTPEVVLDKNIVFTTTNCTKVLERCKYLPPSKEVLIGAFLNAMVIVWRAKRYLDEGDNRMSIVQAGSEGESSLDDLLCAELIKSMILTGNEHPLPPMARNLMNSIAYVVLSNTKHGKYLCSIGFGNDVKYCSQVNVIDVIPRLERDQAGNSRIVRGSVKDD
jgi:2-phosphosulfolactate phosphatase